LIDDAVSVRRAPEPPSSGNAIKSWREILAIFFVLAVIEFALRGPLLLGVTALYQRDLMLVYFPLVQTILREVSLGALPLRDPTSGFGQPLLADPSSHILYPPAWLHLLLSPPVAYGWFVSAHTVFGALGVALLSRRLAGGSFIAGLAGGMMWQQCGPLLSLASLWHHMAGGAWIPWVWLAVERVLVRAPGRTGLGLSMAIGAQMLAGSAEMCAGTLLIAALRIITASGLPYWRTWVGSFVSAAALSAGMWMPAAELLMSSARSALPEAARTFWSLHPLSMIEFFLPVPVSAFPLAPGWQAVLFDGREPFLASMFLGAPILPLCLAAFTDPLVARSVRVAGFLGAAGAVLTAMGKHAFFYSWLVALVPVLGIFRYPSKAMIPAAVLICVFAGVGVASLARSERSRRAAWAGIFAVSVIALAVRGAVPSLARDFMDPARPAGIGDVNRNLPGDLLWTVGLLGLLGAYMSVPRSRLSLLLLAVLAGGQLKQSHALHNTMNPTVPTSALSYRPASLELMRPPPGGRVFVYDYSSFSGTKANRYLSQAAEGWDATKGLDYSTASLLAVRTYMPPLVGGSWDVEYAFDADMRMLFERRLADLTIGLRRVEETPGFVKLLRIAGVHRMVSMHEQGLGELKLLAREDFYPQPLRIFAVPEPLERAFLVSGRRRGGGDDLRDLVDPGFDARTSAIVERDPIRAPSVGFVGAVRVLEERSDRIVLEASANGPALLTLIEGALRGWRAWVDGRPAVVERVNALFIGTEVPAGTHRIEFRFLPASAVVGVCISALTSLLIVLWAGVARRSGP
jgi:Bacterial membrane protein YfhO